MSQQKNIIFENLSLLDLIFFFEFDLNQLKDFFKSENV